MDDTICQQQKHVVDLLALALGAVLLKGFKNTTEVGWSTEFDFGQSLLVSLQNTSDALDFRITCIAINREAVTELDGLYIVRYSAEAKNWEFSIGVVVFNNFSNLANSCLVLVVGPIEVQAILLGLVAIRPGVVNCNNLTDLPAAPQEVSEAICLTCIRLLFLDRSATDDKCTLCDFSLQYLLFGAHNLCHRAIELANFALLVAVM